VQAGSVPETMMARFLPARSSVPTLLGIRDLALAATMLGLASNAARIAATFVDDGRWPVLGTSVSGAASAHPCTVVATRHPCSVVATRP